MSGCAIACDLIIWLQLLARDGELARAEPEPCAIPHAAARLVRSWRGRTIRIPPSRP